MVISPINPSETLIDERPPFVSDRRRLLEILAVLLTAGGKIIFMDLLQWKLLFIVATMAAWGSYVIMRTRNSKGILKYWGFRRDNFWNVVRQLVPFAGVSLVAFFVIGYHLGTIHLNWHIVPILLLYPLWGIIQQFLVIALVAGNLQDLGGHPLSPWIIIVLTAALFGLVHYPYYWLIAGTFVLALLYGYIYLKARNIYVMGLFHGWLGALFFYTVVDRDPFMEVFGRLLSYEFLRSSLVASAMLS